MMFEILSNGPNNVMSQLAMQETALGRTKQEVVCSLRLDRLWDCHCRCFSGVQKLG